ncbi:hemin uptake protein HemP [Chelativorans salis]|uniref:hemin uptake protein HemP n=1 Tax=Chelativorans salis TaxID=2978478 RepID=UPI0028CB6D90|nr:hemin uptake protein HemP [Chelativorans sp. EGI FJ00035]
MRSDFSAERLQPVPVRQGVDFRNSGAIPDRTVTSDDLFCGRREIAIEHAGSFYRLKITRQGKLILNK